VDRLAVSYRQEGKKLGIIAVDPSSLLRAGPSSDRIRMQTLETIRAFISAHGDSRHLGGLATRRPDVVSVLDAAEKTRSSWRPWGLARTKSKL